MQPKAGSATAASPSALISTSTNGGGHISVCVASVVGAAHARVAASGIVHGGQGHHLGQQQAEVEGHRPQSGWQEANRQALPIKGETQDLAKKMWSP